MNPLATLALMSRSKSIALSDNADTVGE